MHEIIRKEFLSRDLDPNSWDEEFPEIDIDELIEMEKQFILDNELALMSDPQLIHVVNDELEIAVKQQIEDFEMCETEANTPLKETQVKWPIWANTVVLTGTVVWCQSDYCLHFNLVLERD